MTQPQCDLHISFSWPCFRTAGVLSTWRPGMATPVSLRCSSVILSRTSTWSVPAARQHWPSLHSKVTPGSSHSSWQPSVTYTGLRLWGVARVSQHCTWLPSMDTPMPSSCWWTQGQLLTPLSWRLKCGVSPHCTLRYRRNSWTSSTFSSRRDVTSTRRRTLMLTHSVRWLTLMLTHSVRRLTLMLTHSVRRLTLMLTHSVRRLMLMLTHSVRWHTVLDDWC